MSRVRPATAADTNAIIALLRALHTESIFQGISIEPAKLSSLVGAFLTRPRHTCLVYDSEGVIDGLIMGYVSEYFFSTELGAWDLAVYVRPERRGSLVAYRLWKEFKAWATANGGKVVWFGTSAGIAPTRTRKFYTGLGMKEVGTLYRLPL